MFLTHEIQCLVKRQGKCTESLNSGQGAITLAIQDFAQKARILPKDAQTRWENAAIYRQLLKEGSLGILLKLGIEKDST